jgi:hypothetical protein
MGARLSGERKSLAISKTTARVMDTAVIVRENPEAEIAYMARELVQCTLPYKDPGDVEVWTRENHGLFIGITPGHNLKTKERLGIPYGSLPRLILFWLTTEAVRTKSRRIELGGNYSEFIGKLGLTTGGGPRGDWTRLREQMTRLLCASIVAQQHVEDSSGRKGFKQRDLNLTTAVELWWDPKNPDQLATFQSWVELSDYFYGLATTAPVPTDMRVLRALKSSPLALDLYTMMTHAAFVASKSGRPNSITWDDFASQLGTGMDRTRDFKRKILAKLKVIQQLYPDLRLADTEGGLAVLPTSKPAIPILKPR